MKSAVFSALLMALMVAWAFWQMHELPDRRPRSQTTIPLEVRSVVLPGSESPLRLAGAWQLKAGDRRLGGLSGLAIDRGRFLAVSDQGAVMRFDPPTARNPTIWLADLRFGPGRWGKKWRRDAESLARDPQGRGWWIGYEQVHSLWLYNPEFSRSLASIDLHRSDWWSNRGAEGLIAEGSHLLVTAENGREAMRVTPSGIERMALDAGADVAEAARAPDGSAWLLLRSKGPEGIAQSIAPLIRTRDGYRAGPGWPVPKDLFDNYEGMAIEPRPGGGWRFWLVTDDGHPTGRTLLVALDYDPPARHDKSPASGPELSKKA